VSVFLLGKGTVGRQLLAQLGAEQVRLRTRHDVDLRLVGVADRVARAFRGQGACGRSGCSSSSTRPTAVTWARSWTRSRGCPCPCWWTAPPPMAWRRSTRRPSRAGIHVVAANKKPLALPRAGRDAIFAAARAAHRAYRYETTVGASLPVIETVKNLVRTGDHVLLHRGLALGHAGLPLQRGHARHAAVRGRRRGASKGLHRAAPARGSLGGVDAARKALILARELGLEVELSQVEVTPLRGRRAARITTISARSSRRWRARTRRSRSAWSPCAPGARCCATWRRSNPGTRRRAAPPSLKVGPVGVPADHPATRLRGTEAFVAFTTERYREYPLVVQGAGAGGAVTAAGVLADVLALSQGLRGR
jgi:aspartokinase/homoserine dehydrogenase 1